MTNLEMTNELKRVEEVFGKKYHEQILRIFWSCFRFHELKRFAYIVDEVLCDSKYFPSINEFKKIDLGLRGSQYQKAKENQSRDIEKNWKEDHRPISKTEQDRVVQGLGDLLKIAKNEQIKHEEHWRKNHLKGNYQLNIIK